MTYSWKTGRKWMSIGAIALALLLLGVYFFQQPGAPEPLPGAATTSADIHAVNFHSFTYTPTCLAEGTRAEVRTEGGMFEASAGDEKLLFTIEAVNYGDLDADGIDEAVVLTSCNTGGSGTFTQGMVYALRDGQVVEIARTEVGDRAAGGIAGLHIEEGMLIMERYATDPAGALCCPKYIDLLSYGWDGELLREVGEPARREAPIQIEPPPEEISAGVEEEQ